MIKLLMLIWEDIYDFWIALKPMRFSALAVIMGGIVLQLGQIQDLFITIAETASANMWAGQVWGLLVSSAMFGIYVWLAARVAARLRFSGESDVITKYRTQFPKEDFEGDLEKVKARALERTASILQWRARLPRVLGTLGVLLIVLAMWRAQYRAPGADSGPLLWLLIGLALLVFLATTYRRKVWNALASRRGWGASKEELSEETVDTFDKLLEEGKPTLILGGIFVVPAIGTIFLAAVEPLLFMHLTGIPVLFGFFAGVALVGTFLTIVSRQSNLPVLSALVAVTLVFMSACERHDIQLEREMADFKRITQRPTTREALANWLEVDTDTETVAEVCEAAETAKPIILVATAGGGIRAAYWTTQVMHNLAEQFPLSNDLQVPLGFNENLFAVSGVSGGAVGAVFVQAGFFGNAEPWQVSKAVGQDFLGPVFAAMLVRDLLPLSWDGRARALEKAWERSWKEETDNDRMADPFLKLWPEGKQYPLLFLNGTIVGTGERIVLSNLNIAGEAGFLAEDFHTLAGGDVRASTAGNHAARFPFIGPAGRIVDKREPPRFEELRIVDGGYFDNFGAQTARDLLVALGADVGGPCHEKLNPIVIQISSNPELSPEDFGDERTNGEDQGSDADGAKDDEVPEEGLSFIPQIRAPLHTLLNTTGAHEAQAVRDLRRAVGDDRFVHFGMCEPTCGQVGEPPLGWSLSEVAKTQIEGYWNGCEENVKALEKLEKLLRSNEVVD